MVHFGSAIFSHTVHQPLPTVIKCKWVGRKAWRSLKLALAVKNGKCVMVIFVSKAKGSVVNRFCFKRVEEGTGRIERFSFFFDRGKQDYQK